MELMEQSMKSRIDFLLEEEQACLEHVGVGLEIQGSVPGVSDG